MFLKTLCFAQRIFPNRLTRFGGKPHLGAHRTNLVIGFINLNCKPSLFFEDVLTNANINLMFALCLMACFLEIGQHRKKRVYSQPLQRSFKVFLLVIIYLFSVPAGFGPAVCVAHEPCESAHERHLADLISSGSGFSGHLPGYSKEAQPSHTDHCACKCPESRDNTPHNGIHAIISNPAVNCHVTKFLPVSQTSRLSNQLDLKPIFHMLQIGCQGHVAALDSLQSLPLLI